MNQKYIPWKPLKNDLSPYSLKSFSDNNEEGFCITLESLSDKPHRLTITWEGLPRAYRSINRKNFTLDQETTLTGQPIFIVQNSRYCEWIVEQSCEIVTKKDLTHFLICTKNYYVEVVYSKEPIVIKDEQSQ